MKQKRNISDEDLIEAYHRLGNQGNIAAEFGIPVVSVYRRCGSLGLSFKNGGHRKIRFKTEDILNGMHPNYDTTKLKNRVIKEGILDYKCERCGISEYNGEYIALHLDHIDGNSHNHFLNNLRLLCPNCHSQTDTYCGRNK